MSYIDLRIHSIYSEFALKHNLLLTCASDFHRKTKPIISIGSSECENNEESIISSLKRSLS